jgi:microcystin-dependent protein
MSENYIGNVVLVGFNFAPRGYAFCNGQLLPIAQNTALFSILGTTYGGNGTTNFALPDLRGRAAIGQGQGAGLSNVSLGEQSGVESRALLGANLPAHTHALNVQSGQGTTGTPGAGVALAQTTLDDGTPINSYSSAAPNTTLASTGIGTTGGGQALPIRNPYLGMNYVICLQGVYPSRN